MIHGSSENHTSAVVGSFDDFAGFLLIVAAELSRLQKGRGGPQTTFGFQIFRKPIRQAIDISDAPISTIHGFM